MKKLLVTLALVLGSLNASAFMADDNTSLYSLPEDSVISIQQDFTVLANITSTKIKDNCFFIAPASNSERIIRAGTKLFTSDIKLSSTAIRVNANLNGSTVGLVCGLNFKNDLRVFPTIGEFRRNIAPIMTLEIAKPIDF